MISKNTRVAMCEASSSEEPSAVIPHAGICEGCALQAHEILWSEMITVVKPSQQPRTESCVVSGNGHCEA